MAVWLVADFEALSYQVTTTFDTSCAARIRTAPAINYTACWQLVFILYRIKHQIYIIFLICNPNYMNSFSMRVGGALAVLIFLAWDF